MNTMTYAFTPDNRMLALLYPTGVINTPDNRMLALWYGTGVINRTTFIYLWEKYNTEGGKR